MSDQAIANALVVLDQVWAETAQRPFVQANLGRPIDRLPDIGFDATEARSARGARLLASIDALEQTQLPHDLVLTLAVARANAERMAKEAERYWLVIDPNGVGFMGLFAPTAYCGGLLIKNAAATLAKHGFDTVADVDRYMGLIEDFARLVSQMRERTVGQSRRGIHIPRCQLDRSIQLVRALAAGSSSLIPSVERLTAVGGDQAAQAIAARIRSSVDAAWQAMVDFLSTDDYRAASPESVGLSQYPGGAELYPELVELHTTLKRTPDEVHTEGLERMGALRARMDALFQEIHFTGTPGEYAETIKHKPDWRAANASEIATTFKRYLDRIAPHINSNFNLKPSAPCEAVELPAALTASMTFGYYDPPGPKQPTGRYYFNADNIISSSLSNIAAVNYHELIPGHHFHLATQRENQALHPLRTNAFFNAFNEGWAEYAATLAGELGMYSAPEERFGRLVMDGFLTSRLVVDTGLNALGWSLAQARDYMQENVLLPPNEIESEIIRYSCDIPGQALAYKLGEFYLQEKREAWREAKGPRFDIREFHDAVLGPGALPLPLVGANIDRKML
ncbi:DUF885 domain-containing protein [Tsuneonella rigui]|uniref:DUF885 domain-containing protein n=1 Tax=Tsuneonella rigui TaxID=1708790 RepID=UPI000F7E50E2|nr:DUF885 domain-containing protein [Tsuneonella rigui]